MSRGTFEVQATTTRPKITVTADGAGVVSHAGTRLLADLADATTLTAELTGALDGARGVRRGTIRVGCWLISPSRSPTVPRPSPTSRCWPISRRCSGRWLLTARAG